MIRDKDLLVLADMMEFPHKFFLAECIKRHFEYEKPEDVEWLKNNWDLPLQKIAHVEYHETEEGNLVHESTSFENDEFYAAFDIKETDPIFFDIQAKMAFYNDFILYYHFEQKNGEQYNGIGAKTYGKLYNYIRENYQDWFKKVYGLSCNYGLSFAELVHSYDIKYLLEKNLISENNFNIRLIPAFLDREIKNNSLVMAEGDDGNLYSRLSLDENMDLKSVCTSVVEKICINYLYKYGLDASNKINTEYLTSIFKNTAQSDDKKETKSSNYDMRYMGLVLYDLLLDADKSMRESRYILPQIKSILKSNNLRWVCSNTEKRNDNNCVGCTGCSSQYRRSLYCAYKSIESMQEEDIKTETIAFDHSRIKKLDRIRLDTQ